MRREKSLLMSRLLAEGNTSAPSPWLAQHLTFFLSDFGRFSKVKHRLCHILETKKAHFG